MTNNEGSLSELETLRAQVNKLTYENKVLKALLGEEDSTGRIRSEAQLKETTEFNAWLLQTIPYGMDIVDYQGTVLFQSRKMQEMFGDGIGSKCWELYREDKKQCRDCPLTSGLDIGCTQVYESHGISGGLIFEISHTAIIYKGKKAMLEIFQDVTKRKETEKAIVVAKEKAEESDRLKSAFLENISHEFRTPMNGIIGFSQLLVKSGLNDTERELYSKKVVEGCERLLGMVNQIIEISDLQHRKIPVEKTVVSANMLLTELLCKSQTKADKKNLQFSIENTLNENQQTFFSDKTKLLRILEYLTDNAIKFTEKGSVRVICKLNTKKQIVFLIKDTGIGIAPEKQEVIFQLFRQNETGIIRRYGGIGLGLAIAKEYTSLLNGKLEIQSKTGEGTSLICSIPYVPYNETLKQKETTNQEPDWSEKTIIVAEDENINFELIQEFLKETNVNLLHAKDGNEAVNLCKQEREVHLILMDLKMPVMDGLTATKLIKGFRAEIPIIAQTAFVQANEMERFSIGEFAGYVTKPVRKQELMDLLRVHIEK